MVNDIVKRLKEILDREVKCFEKIRNILLKEQRHLVKNDREAMKKILSDKEDIVSSLRCLEKSRCDLLEKLSEELEENSTNLTINYISDRVGGEMGRLLWETGRSLKLLYDDIKRTEWSNRQLLQQELEFTRKNLSFMCSLLGEQVTYGIDGDIGGRSDISLKINRHL